jgi:hypothetical protein
VSQPSVTCVTSDSDTPLLRRGHLVRSMVRQHLPSIQDADDDTGVEQEATQNVSDGARLAKGDQLLMTGPDQGQGHPAHPAPKEAVGQVHLVRHVAEKGDHDEQSNRGAGADDEGQEFILQGNEDPEAEDGAGYDYSDDDDEEDDDIYVEEGKNWMLYQDGEYP